MHAAISVNHELILHYSQVGQEILKRQGRKGWGAKVIERLANDLRREFTDMRGLCRDKNHMVVEYALRNMHQPIGVAEYRLSKALPESLKGSLPTVEQLEAELKGMEMQKRDEKPHCD